MNWEMPEDGPDQQDSITPRGSIRSIDFFNESQSSMASHEQHNRGAIFGLDLNFETHEYLQPTLGDNIDEPVAGVKRRGSDPARNKGSTTRGRAAGTGGTTRGRGVVERRTNSTANAAAGIAGSSRGRCVAERRAISTGHAAAGTGPPTHGRGVVERRTISTGHAPAAGGRGGFRLPPTVPRGVFGVRRGGAVGHGSASHSTTTGDAHLDEDADANDEEDESATGSEVFNSCSNTHFLFFVGDALNNAVVT